MTSTGALPAVLSVTGAVHAVPPVTADTAITLTGTPIPPATTVADNGSLPGERLLHLANQISRWAAQHGWVLPAAAVVVAALVVAWQCGRARLAAWREHRLAQHAQQVIILPPPVVEAAGTSMWWANIAGLLRPAPWRRLIYGPAHIGVEYRWSGRALQVIVWVPGSVPAGPVAAAARAAWPGASTRIEDATDPLPRPTRTRPTRTRAARTWAGEAGRPGEAGPGSGPVTRQDGAALVAAMPTWYPLATLADHDGDPLRALIAAGADLHANEAGCVQILARVAGNRPITRARSGAAALRAGRPASGPLAERLLTGALRTLTDLLTPAPGSPGRRSGGAGASRTPADLLREHDARPGMDKLTGPQWQVAIRIGVTHTANPARTAASTTTPTRQVVQAVRGRRLGAGTRPGRGGDGIGRRLSVLTHQLASALAVHDAANRLRRVRLANPAAALAARTMRAGFLLSAPELCALAGLPTDVSVPGLDRARARAVPVPIAVPGGGRGTKVLGRSQVGGHSVALPVVDARQHVHVLGSTGAGKSTWMTHMILDDIKAGRGLVLIDPKGDLALDVLDRLPLSAAGRLVLIDPDQGVGSANFNPLELRPGADADLIVDNIVAIFAAIFQRHWGPRIDDVLRVSCLTLMRHPRPTLTNVPLLLNNKQARSEMTVGFDDPAGLAGFWEWYESTAPALRAQVIGPVLARLRAFLLRDFVRSTIGAPRSSFDMRRVLDGGGILIARLPKGQLGEDTSRLLGSLIFGSVWQAATARAAVTESRRRDASVYVDEAHTVLNLPGTVDGMLAEARGYHLSMVLAHQHLAQLERNTQLALSANARNKIFFSCSPEDARQLARHTLPELDEHDLSHLDAYVAAARLVIGNRETAAFTLATNPPTPVSGHLSELRAAIAAAAPPARPDDQDDDEDGTETQTAPPAPTRHSDRPTRRPDHPEHRENT